MPRMLKERGASTALQLRRLGFDSLHIVDAKFCQELLDAFGADDTKQAFLTTPEDAVSIAGCSSVDLLNVSNSDLLTLCAGAPAAAEAVLQQSALADPLAGIDVSTVLDTGVDYERATSAYWDLEYDMLRDVAIARHHLKQIASRLCGDKDVVLPAVQRDGEALRHASDELCDDDAFVLAAVLRRGEAFGEALRRVSIEQCGHMGVVLAAVKQDGRALQYASDELRDDEAVVRAAVQQDGGALQYASTRLRRDKAVVRAAVKRGGYGW